MTPTELQQVASIYRAHPGDWSSALEALWVVFPQVDMIRLPGLRGVTRDTDQVHLVKLWQDVGRGLFPFKFQFSTLGAFRQWGMRTKVHVLDYMGSRPMSYFFTSQEAWLNTLPGSLTQGEFEQAALAIHHRSLEAQAELERLWASKII